MLVAALPEPGHGPRAVLRRDWVLVPRHLQQALEVSESSTASYSRRVKVGLWAPLALEALRVVLTRRYVDASEYLRAQGERAWSG